MAISKEDSTKLKDEFESVFKACLDDFMRPFTGFDVIKFDEWLHVPEEKTTEEEVLSRYGKKGMNVVMRILQMDIKNILSWR